jgi:plastocyanin
MNKIAASIGLVLIAISIFFFYVVFNSGSIAGAAVTDGSPAANFDAFFLVLLALPIGCGLSFFGFAYHKPLFAAGVSQQVVYKGSPRIATAALALAVIALVLGAAAFAELFSATGTQGSSINSLQTQFNSLSGKVSANLSSVSVTPTQIAYRIDWSNVDPTGQDRFFPNVIVVAQGDVVQILFEHNDTDAHTFTITHSPVTPYGFQINDTFAGMRDFLDNKTFTASCVNASSFAQQSSGLSSNGWSTSYCVSGISLLPTGSGPGHAGNFRIAVNPNPALPLNVSGNPSVIVLPIDNQVHDTYFNASGLPATPPPLGIGGIYGTGAFIATTPGIFEFFCDYHVSNGMFGYLIVLPNAYCNSNPSSCT